MSEIMPGGWSGFNFTLNKEAKDVFDAALQGFVGVKYTPLAFATQVVAGKNYCYLCQGKVVYPGGSEIVALVYIYKPLKGDAHVTKINPINP